MGPARGPTRVLTGGASRPAGTGVAQPPVLRIGAEFVRSTFDALDPELVGEVLAVILDLAQEGWTLVIVTHEVRFARDVADQVLFLDGGVVAERGGAEALTDPREERTQQFLRRILEAG